MVRKFSPWYFLFWKPQSRLSLIGCTPIGFTIIITCARCDHPSHNPCTMQCKLPIAMQTDECRRQYEDFSLAEHAADDNGMHCDAIFNEQYAKCSPYSKMQRALKYKFTQCKPWDYLLENASHTELLLLRRGLSHYTSKYNISQVPQPTCSSKSKWVGEPDYSCIWIWATTQIGCHHNQNINILIGKIPKSQKYGHFCPNTSIYGSINTGEVGTLL